MVGRSVVVAADLGVQVLREAGGDVAGHPEGLDAAGVAQHPARLVGGVGGADAAFVTGGAGVAEVVDLGEQTAVVEGPADLGGLPSVVGAGVAADALDVGQVAPGGAAGSGGPVQPRLVDGLGLDRAAGLVVGQFLEQESGQAFVVAGGSAFGVGDDDVPGASGRCSAVPVHAPQEHLFGLALGSAVVAFGDPYAFVAAPLRPAPAVLRGEPVVVVAPGGGTHVLVVGLHRFGAAGAVVLDHVGDDVLVEPVLHDLLPGWRPEHGVAAPRVRVWGGEAVRPSAVLRGVVDLEDASGLVLHGLDAPLVHRRVALQGVDPVDQLHPVEVDDGDVGGAAHAALVLDGVQPQRGAGAVTGGGETVGQGPAVHVGVCRSGQDLGGDRRQAFPRPEGRRDQFGAGLTGRAVVVVGGVRPAVGVGGGQLAGVAGEGVGG